MTSPPVLDNSFDWNTFETTVYCYRMAPEVIACDENPDATYDNRVCTFPPQLELSFQIPDFCSKVSINKTIFESDKNWSY